jgi:hypothetical protein
MKNFKLALAGIAILIWAILVIARAEKTQSKSGVGSASKKNAPIIITQKQELLFYPYCSPFATAY